MRVLGMDLGTKRLGLAITDRSLTIASKMDVLSFRTYDDLYEVLLNIINSNDVSKIVLGLPKNMDNSLGFASERSMNFKEWLEDKYNLEVILVDERLSTMEAERYLLDVDMSRDKRKKVIDSYAACIILETYLKGLK